MKTFFTSFEIVGVGLVLTVLLIVFVIINIQSKNHQNSVKLIKRIFYCDIIFLMT